MEFKKKLSLTYPKNLKNKKRKSPLKCPRNKRCPFQNPKLPTPEVIYNSFNRIYILKNWKHELINLNE
jgi:hypothetical protein